MTDLILSKKTIDILQNFSMINQSILFRKGNELRTISGSWKVFAKANIEEEIPQEFAIHELQKLLSVMTNFEKPVLKFDNKNDRLTITDKDKKVVYKFVNKELIVAAPETDISIKNQFLSFNLTAARIMDIQKIKNILTLPHIALVSNKGKLYIECIDFEKFKKGENTENHFVLNLPEKPTDDFRIIFAADFIDNLMKNNDYEGSLGFVEKDGEKNCIMTLIGQDVTYFLPSEPTSEF